MPEGDYYSIEGTSYFDDNANGCDSEDLIFPNIKFGITNSLVYGTTISNDSGDYKIPIQAGAYSVYPIFENPEYFTISPSSFTVDFPTDASPFNQDFCIISNGIKNDLEIFIIPTNQARPGFDADYKIIYKNKGNTTLSGTLELIYE